MSIWSRRLSLVIADLILVNAGVLLAFTIRFEGGIPVQYIAQYERVALWFSILSVAAFLATGLYSRLWRYASVDEVFTVLRGVTVSSALLALLIFLPPKVTGSWEGFPRSIFILTWLLNCIMVGGLRFSIRMALSWRGNRAVGGGNGQPTRVLLIGAGDAGAMVAREVAKHPEMGYQSVGFLDDDPHKRGLKVHGIPVVGSREDLRRVIKEKEVGEVIITMPSAGRDVVRQVVSECTGLGVKVKTLPGVYELINGRVTVNQIREVQIEDLLGREPVGIDLDEVAGYLRGETVLVTGAGGSIGGELCRQVARFDPALLVMLDHDENGIFEISLDLDQRFPRVERKLVVADVRDRAKIFRVFQIYHPGIVFHAAAHKHVPLMEECPDEAVKTNIFGTKNVAQASYEQGVRKFAFISTDKAVNPTSVMGATKRIAEMVVLDMDGGVSRNAIMQGVVRSKFMVVRFGNVLGSRGSVVPVFRDQIARGGPVTVTHPEMRRYFMTIPEAVQLVIQAGAIGQGGEIFVLDMGEPVRILDLAHNMIRLSGYEPNVDISIEFIGPRIGEKLYEETLTVDEGVIATKHKRIYEVPSRGRLPENFQEVLTELEQTLFRHPPGTLLDLLKALVPEYSGTANSEVLPTGPIGLVHNRNPRDW